VVEKGGARFGTSMRTHGWSWTGGRWLVASRPHVRAARRQSCWWRWHSGGAGPQRVRVHGVEYHKAKMVGPTAMTMVD
jgi:hypothetical protein